MSDEISHTRTEKEEINYLKENDLVKCGNCGNIWDGCAQCHCYADTDCYIYQDCDTKNDTVLEEPVLEEPVVVEKKEYMRSSPPTRPVPVPDLYVDKPGHLIKKLKEEIMTLKEENRILVENIASLNLN